jgi:hypothetical protein
VSGPGPASRAESLRRVEAEIRRAKAEALGRLGERLDAVLAALAAHDEGFDRLLAEADRSRDREPRLRHALELRNRLREEACRLVQHLIIQREAIGLLSHASVLERYPVPPTRQLDVAGT